MPGHPRNHREFPLSEVNSGSFFHQGILPLPPTDGLSVKINGYDDVQEPKFDPKVHLDLKKPKFIRVFPGFEKTDRSPRVVDSSGSLFGYSSPFQVRTNSLVACLQDWKLFLLATGTEWRGSEGCQRDCLQEPGCCCWTKVHQGLQDCTTRGLLSLPLVEGPSKLQGTSGLFWWNGGRAIGTTLYIQQCSAGENNFQVLQWQATASKSLHN